MVIAILDSTTGMMHTASDTLYAAIDLGNEFSKYINKVIYHFYMGMSKRYTHCLNTK